ncbi:MAG: hypothetical protein HWE22_07795 [Flavobacteriales bacterium]|nr:hypothetical protein [Flavobacteriales bacterium]
MKFSFSTFLLLSIACIVGGTVAAQTANGFEVNTSSNSWNETKTVLTLSENRTTYDNRMDVDFDSYQNPVIIYGIEKEGSYIQALTKNWEPAGTKIELPGIYFMDFLVINGAYYVLGKESAGYTGDGALDYEEEGNVLVFLKFDVTGRLLFKRQLFGNEGTTGGSYFLCTYSSIGELAFDGTYFHTLVETCGNFTSKGSLEFDIHETDYYLTFDMNGIVRENGRSPWNHSHSSLPHTISDGIGEGVTVTVGDASPFGICFTRFSNGKKASDRVLHPNQDVLPYEDMYAVSKSSTDAGEVGGIVRIGDYFYTVITTVPQHSLPVLNQKKDFLFLKLDLNGNEVSRRWIKTPYKNESVPLIIEQEGNIFMAFMHKTGEYDYDYKATIALLNTNGDYLVAPQKTDYTFNYQSRLTQHPNGDIILLSVEPYSSEAEIIQFEFTQTPATRNALSTPTPYDRKKPAKIVLKGR